MKAILLQKELSNFLKQNGTESFSKLVFDSIIAVGGNINTMKNVVKKYPHMATSLMKILTI